VRWGCCGVLKSGTFGVFWDLSPNFSNCTVHYNPVGESTTRQAYNSVNSVPGRFLMPVAIEPKATPPLSENPYPLVRRRT